MNGTESSSLAFSERNGKIRSLIKVGKVGHHLLGVIPTHLLHRHPTCSCWHHWQLQPALLHTLALPGSGCFWVGSELLAAHYWAMERQQWSIYTVIEDMRASYSSTVQQDIVQLAPAQVEWNQVSRALSQADHWNIYQGLHCCFQRPVLRSLPELPCHCHSNQTNWQKFRHNCTHCNSTYSYIHKGERETATCTA